MSKKSKTPDLPMKWYFALIYFFIPLDLLSDVIHIIRAVVRLFTGNIQGFFMAGNTPLPITPPFIIELAYNEVISLACMVLLLIAWIHLLKRKSNGPKLFLIQLLIALADIPATILHYLLIKPYVQANALAGTGDLVYYIGLGIVLVGVNGTLLLLFFLNRLYFKKRTYYFYR